MKISAIGLAVLAAILFLYFLKTYPAPVTSHKFMSNVELKNYISFKYTKPIQDLSDKLFIAHAGGAIDGIIYTDSLEAINKSYASGYRYIELDLHLTKDQHLVAVHNWEEWKYKSGYNGPIPPTLSQFMNTKVFGRFSPISAHEIEQWFLAHPDAFLVTDKINDPAAVKNSFSFYSSRILMELFTWEAIDKAKQTGVYKVLANGYLVLNDPDGIKKALTAGVSYLTIGRSQIPKHLDIIRPLQGSDINIILYGLNSDGHLQHKDLSKFMAIADGAYID